MSNLIFFPCPQKNACLLFGFTTTTSLYIAVFIGCTLLCGVLLLIGDNRGRPEIQVLALGLFIPIGLIHVILLIYFVVCACVLARECRAEDRRVGKTPDEKFSKDGVYIG